MPNQMFEEYGRLEDRLSLLRQAIIRVDPSVMVDGRFEEMFVAPINVIDVARQLIETMPQIRQ